MSRCCKHQGSKPKVGAVNIKVHRCYKHQGSGAVNIQGSKPVVFVILLSIGAVRYTPSNA
jgi:hypothetical protein